VTPQQLKNSLLQMAMQGKLVEQRPEEGTGEELYQQIQKEKQKLIKEGKIKKEKPLPEITEDEVAFEIPESWKWTYIGEIFQHNTGKALNGVSGPGNMLTYITTSNLYWDRFELDRLKEMPFTDEEVAKCTVQKNDLLVCEGGDFGRAAIWPYDEPIRIQNHIHRLRAYSEISVRYFYYLFYLYKNAGLISGKGIGIQGLSSNALHRLRAPLPPLAEQNRIVAKIEEIMPYIDRYAVAYDHLQSYNTRFPDDLKKSILQMAIQGKLVPQDPNDEPASVLLEKIAKEKQKLVKEGKIKKQKPLPPIKDKEIPFDIPESWVWVRLGNVITDTEAGKSPQCKNRPATKQEWGVIKTTAIQDGYFLADENKVLPSGFQIKSDQVVHAGDLLITRAGPQNRTGVTCIVNNEPGNLILSDKTVRIRYVKGFVNENYLMYALKSPAVQRCITGAKSGMAESQVNISQNNMRLFVLPFPPLAEQKRIVAKLDELLPQIDGLK
jgi:type I restriction enzyme S subunit